MYHSVLFGKDDVFKNTYDDWKIVPTERPVIVTPSQKTNYLDIPGADGSLDLSDTLTGYPVFNDREGSLSFYVLNEYDNYDWARLYSDICTYLHGSKMQMILEDDPEWYYYGRFWVESWSPDSYHSQVTIKYRVGPYKWSTQSSTDPNWLWDSFNFETDMILHTQFKDIQVRSDTSWTTKRYVSTAIGQAPACPDYIINSNSGNGMDVFVRNNTSGTYAEAHLQDGVSSDHGLMIFGGDITLGFKGAGVVSVDFRRGRL